MEKSNGHDHCPSQDGEESADQALSRLRTANSVSMSPELFEKLYLQTPGRVKGDLRQTFANPTPLGLVGFVVGLTPLSCCLIGWRGAGGLGAADMCVPVLPSIPSAYSPQRANKKRADTNNSGLSWGPFSKIQQN